MFNKLIQLYSRMHSGMKVCALMDEYFLGKFVYSEASASRENLEIYRLRSIVIVLRENRALL